MSDDQSAKTVVGQFPPWQIVPVDLGELTTDECSSVLSGPHPTVVLPIGSTEPHGPHLPLATDAILASECAQRAARTLRTHGVSAVVAPVVSYGVTRYAAGFAGAITLSPALVEQLVRELCVGYREAGFALVCVTNHHLEPEHVAAITRAVDGTHAARGGACFANQLSRRWGRTLSTEFKRGDCHAGAYETSLVMAARPRAVHEETRRTLPAVPISLADAIRAGQGTFREIGLTRAYCGAPADATREHGEEQYARLVEMVVTEAREALGLVARG